MPKGIGYGKHGSKASKHGGNPTKGTKAKSSGKPTSKKPNKQS